MLTALFHAGPFGGPGLWIIHPILTLVWIGLLIALLVVVARKRRAIGPWGGPPWAAAHAARTAESTLAERFANGDIDEKEYRARLEVLRANGPVPPSS